MHKPAATATSEATSAATTAATATSAATAIKRTNEITEARVSLRFLKNKHDDLCKQKVAIDTKFREFIDITSEIMCENNKNKKQLHKSYCCISAKMEKAREKGRIATTLIQQKKMEKIQKEYNKKKSGYARAQFLTQKAKKKYTKDVADLNKQIKELTISIDKIKLKI